MAANLRHAKSPVLTNEFLLTAACSRWPPTEERNEAIRRAAATLPIDWERVPRVAARHRVVGLVHDGFTRAKPAVPAAIAKTIANAATAQQHQNLRLAAEAVRLVRLFDADRIAVTFFKGLTTALDIYGDLGIRHSKDLDLLVARDAIERAERLLADAGYQRFDPPMRIKGARLATLIRVGKDFRYERAQDRSIEIELHWRLFRNTKFMNRLSETAVCRNYPMLDNATLRTFSGEDQFAYLCAHGSDSAFMRLKWLADVGALLAREEGLIERLYHAAVERGAGRPAAQAILLCHRLLGTEVAASFVAELRKDSAVRRLERLAIVAMTQGGAEIEPQDLPGGLAPVARSRWLLNGTARFLWGEIKASSIGWDDVIDVALPGGLQFAYPILRVPLWLWRRVRTS